jgi:hypothetical protein
MIPLIRFAISVYAEGSSLYCFTGHITGVYRTYSDRHYREEQRESHLAGAIQSEIASAQIERRYETIWRARRSYASGLEESVIPAELETRSSNGSTAIGPSLF